MAFAGLTIRGGSSDLGAGISHCPFADSSLTLTDCVVTGNSATGASEGGGGIANLGAGFCGSAPELVLVDSTVSLNTVVKDGAGIYNRGGSVAVTAATFSDNDAVERGGAIFTTGGGVVAVAASDMLTNTAGTRGGAIFNDGGPLVISDTTISGNMATQDGGGLFLELPTGMTTIDGSTISLNSSSFSGGGIAHGQGMLDVTNCTIEDNSATSFGGGAISTGSGVLTVTDSVIRNNTAARGGGIETGDTSTIVRSTISGNTATGLDGGGITTGGGSLVDIDDSTISGNTAAGSGGGVFSERGGNTLFLTNVTLSGNEAQGGFGGGIAANGSTLTGLRNVTIVDNTASSGGGGLTEVNAVVLSSIIADDSSCGLGFFQVADVEIGSLADHGGPTLTHALTATSPAIDAGNDSDCAVTDQRGMPRFDGNANGTITCDVGAYEYHLCGTEPATGCLTGEKASFSMSNKSDDSKDHLKWKLSKGDALDHADLGSPATSTIYTMCVYDSTAGQDGLVGALVVAPGGLWEDKAPKGFKYKDKCGASDGVGSVQLKTGAKGKAKAQLKAKGANTPMPVPLGAEYLDLDPRVTVQLVSNASSSVCWTSEFTSAKKNDGEKFKAKGEVLAPTTCPVSFDLGSVAGAGGGPTLIETGNTGLWHNQDLPDGYTLSVATTCAAASPPCGVCTVDGVLGGQGRCSNDPTIVCETVEGPDAACGGADCNVFLVPPTGGNVASSGICTRARLVSDVVGTIDNETGAIALSLDTRTQVYSDEAGFLQPCPLCTGDFTPNDGVRDGRCSGGANSGSACDTNGEDAVFGDTSLDCPPSVGKNISGLGGTTSVDLTTGTASLTAQVSCGGSLSAFDCHCRVCSGDTTLACNSDDECAAASAGTCSATGGSGAQPVPNGCAAEAFECPASGECATTSVDYCDGFLDGYGDGVLQCSTNTDCSVLDSECPGGDCGSCSLTQNTPCFSDTIGATGTADPDSPVLVGVTCFPLINSPAANAAAGLPGPQRQTRTMSLSRSF